MQQTDPDTTTDLATATRQNLIFQYREDNRPWVVAYSGGKDSTLLLQLVYEVLEELGNSAHKEVHVVASDTRVEAPNVEDYLHERMTHLEANARAKGLPVKIHIVTPAADTGQ